MSDQVQLSFVGDWRITVTGRDASWAQRVTASGTASGTQTLGGNPGAAMDVYGDGQVPWTLSIEHDDGTHGWQPSFVRGTSAISGPRLSWVVESEDDTSPSSDRDFNDLVIGLGKLGLVGQPVPPFAILPSTLQAMPEGVFEATLGRYLMAVRVQNIWTLPWPASARVRLSDRCRAWLAAAGVNVVDSWSVQDEEALGQQVVAGGVVVGALGAWETRRIYFKVDVANAAVRKHQVEVQVTTDQGAEDVALLNKAARGPISVTRTGYDPAQQAFVSRSDVGVLTASIKRMSIDLTTFSRAVGAARQSGLGGGAGGGGGAGAGAAAWADVTRERSRWSGRSCARSSMARTSTSARSGAWSPAAARAQAMAARTVAVPGRARSTRALASSSSRPTCNTQSSTRSHSRASSGRSPSMIRGGSFC